MRHFFTTKIKIVLLAAVLIAAVSAVVLSLTGNSYPSTVVQGILAPLRAGATHLTAQAEKLYDYIFSYESLLAENEALKVWIYKVLLTERYRYLAYDDSYGITIEPYQGRAPNSQYTADRICQNIREGLMVNPYIARINHIEVEKRERDDLAITVDVTSIYSDESLTVTAGRSEA